MRCTAQEYLKSPPKSFLLYIASNDTMVVEMDIRVRLTLFLQGSSLYNPRAVRERLQAPGVSEIFAYERAVIDGKVWINCSVLRSCCILTKYIPGQLGHHRKALTILVHEVHDSVSAEAYCALGGIVVPTKIATAVGDRRGLQAHAWLVSMGGRRGAPVTEEKRRELLKTLMEVYTLGGYIDSRYTFRFPCLS